MKIEAYSYPPRTVSPYFSEEDGGFDEGTLTPMNVHDDLAWDMFQMLDNITLAAESGLLDTEKFVKQLFKNKKSFLTFLDMLSNYDDEFRITDRWWNALSALTGQYGEECGFIATSDIAAKLYSCAIGTKQVKA